MADGIVIPIDGDDTAIQRKFLKIKRQAASAGSDFGNASAQAARMGGVGGGIAGRALGGFNQGGAAGMVGLAITAAGLGINGFLARDAEAVSMARDATQRLQARDARARTVIERRDTLAATGASYTQTLRAAGFRGDSQDKIYQMASLAGKYGLSVSTGMDIYAATSDTKGVSADDVAKGLASGVMGENAGSVAASIKKYGGLANAIAVTQKMSKSDAEAAIGRIGKSDLSKTAAGIGKAGNPVEMSALTSAMTGETKKVLGQAAYDALNPGERLARDAAQAATDTMTQLAAAAKAQSTLAAALAEIGRVIGMSEGAESRKLVNFAKGQPLPER